MMMANKRAQGCNWIDYIFKGVLEFESSRVEKCFPELFESKRDIVEM